MPKPFLIGVEVEEAAFGSVVRKLDGLDGVIKIHMNWDKERLASKPNGSGQPRGPYKPRGDFEETGEQAVASILHGKPPMTAKQLRDAFIAQKRSGASISSVLHKMKSNGELQLGDDGYSLTKKMRDRMRARKNYAKKK